MSLVTLGVSDVARSTAFYEALGWRRSSASNEEVTFIATADGVLALWSFCDLAADAGVEPGARPATGSVAIAVNVESADEVDRVVDVARAAGATVARPPGQTPWGGRSGYFADPDGHLWEVAHNPGFPLDEHGSVVLPA